MKFSKIKKFKTFCKDSGSYNAPIKQLKMPFRELII